MTHFQSQFSICDSWAIDNDVPSIPRDEFFWGNFQALKGPIFIEFFVILKSTSIISDLVCFVEVVDDL